MKSLRSISVWLILLGLALSNGTLFGADTGVLDAEQKRIAVVEQAATSVVAIFAGAAGGGSGVVISPDGYVLTNFHVVQGAGNFLKCGLNDGNLYDAVIVGIDPTGDVAMIKLFGREDFPAARMGNSDHVAVGDWAFAMGNPFLLATDFHPTVTFGIVSGIHRYQYPAGTILEYTDCIQVDSSINPGNSGGPLFDAKGDLIGINGRGSFEKRGRVNSGAGYAISINQIKHFMDSLRSGRIVDHATLGATVATDNEGQVVVTEILEESEAYRRGLRHGDEIVTFAGRALGSANQYKNVLGIYPKGWKLPLVYRRDGNKEEIYVRLRGLHRKSELSSKPKPQPEPRQKRGKPKSPDDETPEDKPPEGQPPNPHGAHPPAAKPPAHLAKFFVEKDGFSNYYFNQLAQERTLSALKKMGDFSTRGGLWKITGTASGRAEFITSEAPAKPTPKSAAAPVEFQFKLGEKGAGLTVGKSAPYFQQYSDLVELKDEPPGTGGLLTAIQNFRLLLTKGPAAFSDFYYLGSEPLDGRGEEVDVIAAELGGAHSYWYFSRTEAGLLGFQFELTEDAEPCEVRFADLQDFGGFQFPRTLTVTHADQAVAVFTIEQITTASAAQPEKKSADEPVEGTEAPADDASGND